MSNLSQPQKVFTKFATNDILSNLPAEIITKGLWSNNQGSLSTFFTSSTETATQKTYYYEVFNSASTAAAAESQFSVAYGNRLGSGSILGAGSTNDSTTRAIYSQYKLMLLEPGDTQFTISGSNTDSIYIVNVNRARLRESIDYSNFELCLGALSGSHVANSSHTGSNVRINTLSGSVRLIPDTSAAGTAAGIAGKRYNLVSGSIASGVQSSTDIYGLVYPQVGVVILNANKLDTKLGFNTVTGSNIAGDNAFKIFTSISGAAADFSLPFQARSSETVKSTYYFVNALASEYNYSSNPTFVSGSTGVLAQPTFKPTANFGGPKTYITTVGLYDNSGNLLAVGKLSQPLLKTNTRQALIKVKLDF
jgi:hypothetical protein